MKLVLEDVGKYKGFFYSPYYTKIRINFPKL